MMSWVKEAVDGLKDGLKSVDEDIRNRYVDHLRGKYLQPWTDLRAVARKSKKGSKSGKIRTAKDITGIVLHSTGGPSSRTPAGYAERIGTNFAIMPDGNILLLFDEVERRPSSNGFNDSTVAVEFIGHYPMTNGNWRKKGVPNHDVPTKDQIHAGRRLIKYMRVAWGITNVHAHRQASMQRPDCPGMHVWYNVGEWALKQGLTEGSTSGGRTIPKEWRDSSLDLLTPSN